jgi:hypothetical protein
MARGAALQATVALAAEGDKKIKLAALTGFFKEAQEMQFAHSKAVEEIEQKFRDAKIGSKGAELKVRALAGENAELGAQQRDLAERANAPVAEFKKQLEEKTQEAIYQTRQLALGREADQAEIAGDIEQAKALRTQAIQQKSLKDYRDQANAIDASAKELVKQQPDLEGLIKAQSQSAKNEIWKKTAEEMKNAALDLDAQKNVSKQLLELRQQLAAVNLSPGQAAAQAARDAHATEAQAKQIEGITNQIAAMQALKQLQQEMADDGQRMWDETRTPLEKYNAELARLHELQLSGDIDKETAGRERKQIQDRLIESKRISEYQPPQLLTAGSSAAASFMAQAWGPGVDSQQDALRAQLRANEVLQQIADNTSATGSNVLVAGIP